MRQKIVIIGAGPGGLASAMLLSHAGADVTLLEQKPYVGGRTSSLHREGYTFDLGPTFFLYPDVLREIYAQCGLRMEDEFEMTRLDPNYRLIFEGRGEIDVTSDVDRMEQRIAEFSAEDGANFRAFLSDNRRKFGAFKSILQRPFSSVLDVMHPSMLKMLPFFRPSRSVDQDLGRFFNDPRIRLACAFQSKYLGMSPYQCPSIFTILSYLEYEYGVFHPKGGCGAVSRAMGDAARRLGADIRLGEPVRDLRFEGRRARAVITDEGEYPCDALVINGDFSKTMTTLVPNHLRKRWSNKTIARKKYSCSTFMMYLGVDGTYPELAHHNILLDGNYQQTLREIANDHRLGDSPSVYVCNPCVTDPSMAPPGKSAIYVLVPVSHQHPNIDWDSSRDSFRKLAFGQLAKMGFPDIESKIELEQIITPDTWSADYSVYRGAVFNLAHSLDQMLFLRPNNRFEDLESVYLVGGGTHPGSGLPVIYESARISSKLVMKDLGMAS
ncbi:MAG: phytoene desaturase family protein [Opitutaceae bacterium]